MSCSYQGTEHFPSSHPLSLFLFLIFLFLFRINNPLLFRLQKNSAEREEEGEKEEEEGRGGSDMKGEGNVLNLSHQAQSDVPDDSLSRRSDSDIGEPEVGTDDDMDCVDEGGEGRREEVSIL